MHGLIPKNMTEQTLSLVNLLLRQNGIKVNFEELRFQLFSHPHFPNLRAISASFEHFNIDNLVVRVPIDAQTLLQLPTTFLTHMALEKEVELVLVTRHTNYYLVTHLNGRKIRLEPAAFLNEFTGLVIAVEGNDTTEPIKGAGMAMLKGALVGTAMLLLFTLLALLGLHYVEMLYLLLSLLGIWVSITIINRENGLRTTLGDALCTGESERGCDAVLESEGSQVFGHIKLSTLSAMYFTGLSLSMVLLSLQSEGFVPIYILSGVATLITVYSLYYQWRVIRSWCRLCLTIVLLLWGQAAIALQYNLGAFAISYLQGTVILLGFVSSFLLWSYLSPLFQKLNALTESRVKFFKFKSNPEFFRQLLQKSRTYDTRIMGISEAAIGSSEAPLEVLVATNPFCGFCREVHFMVEEIYEHFQDQLHVWFRFNVDVDRQDSESHQVGGRLLEIYHQSGQAAFMQAMHEIYDHQNAKKWMKKWGLCQAPEPYQNTLNVQKKWLTENALNFTPVLLVNGKAFPKEYDNSDLKLFIEELIESTDPIQPEPTVVNHQL